MATDSQSILADLRDQFGATKGVLYAEELAEVLGKSVEAVYSLTARNGLPIPVLSVGGRKVVSIYAVADWLSGNAV